MDNIFQDLAYRVAREVAAEKDRHHRVILEDIQGKFNFLAEGQEILGGRMDALEVRMGELGARMDAMEDTMDTVVMELRGKADREEVGALRRRGSKLERP